MRPLYCITFVLFSLVLAGCTESNTKAMSLEYFDRVYVALDPKSLNSLNSALGNGLENYGEVTATDFKPIYHYSRQDSGEMLAIYTDSKLPPAGTVFMPIRVKEILRIALADTQAVGIAINPAVPNAVNYSITRDEIRAVLNNYTDKDPLPLEIFVAK